MDIPQILYNVPGRTGCDMLHDTVLAWRRCRTSSASRTPPATSARPELLARARRDFAVYSGDDATALALMLPVATASSR